MQNAVLVTFNTSSWSIERKDKRLTAEAAKSLKLGAKAGVWRKYKADPDDPKWKAIRTIRGFVWNRVIYKYTLPWAHGVRLCSALAIEELQDKVAEYEKQYWAAVDEFCAQRDDIMDWAQVQFGEYYDAGEYHDLSRNAFGFSLSFTPVPQADFQAIADLAGNDLAEKLAAEMVTDQQRQMQNATRDIYDKLDGALRHAVDRLSTGARMTDNILGNLRELAGLLPLLNVTGDKALDERRREISALLRSFSTDSLQDKENRKSCAAQVADILSKLP